MKFRSPVLDVLIQEPGQEVCVSGMEGCIKTHEYIGCVTMTIEIGYSGTEKTMILSCNAR